MTKKKQNCFDWPIQIEVPIEKLIPDVVEFLSYLVEDRVPLNTLPVRLRDYIFMMDGYLNLIIKMDDDRNDEEPKRL